MPQKGPVQRLREFAAVRSAEIIIIVVYVLLILVGFGFLYIPVVAFLGMIYPGAWPIYLLWFFVPLYALARGVSVGANTKCMMTFLAMLLIQSLLFFSDTSNYVFLGRVTYTDGQPTWFGLLMLIGTTAFTLAALIGLAQTASEIQARIISVVNARFGLTESDSREKPGPRDSKE